MPIDARQRRNGRTAFAVAALVILSAWGCGTRAETDRASAGPAAATAKPDKGAATTPDTATSGATTPDTAAPAAAATGSASSASPNGSPITTAPKAQTGGRTNAPAGAAFSGAASSGGSASGGSGGASSAKSTPGSATSPAPGGGSTPTPAVPVDPSQKSPVSVASVGTYSGPAASTLKPFLDGAQLWVKYINDKGGLNGHKVQMLVYDDGGDPARHRAQVQEAVENRKVAAFYQNTEALTGPSSNDYIKANRVPVIGIDGGWDFPYENPMYFPQHPSGASHYLTFVLSTARQAKELGKTKIGVLTCQEAQGCTDTTGIWRDRAKALGIDVVYSGRASIAQPDFTAECLAARNAGSEIFFILMDGNSVTRVASSCGRQNWKPQWILAGSVILDRHKEDLQLQGALGSSTVMPYIRTGTPASDEYQRAFKTYGGGLQNGVGPVIGWTGGKLLERAGAQLSEPPTTESILKGLWSIKGDDLGGLTYPLNFAEGKPAARVSCWFSMQVKDKQWVSPDGYQRYCGQ